MELQILDTQEAPSKRPHFVDQHFFGAAMLERL